MVNAGVDYEGPAALRGPIVDALRLHDSDGAVHAVQEHIMLIWPKIKVE